MRSRTCNCHGIAFRTIPELVDHLHTQEAIDHATDTLRKTIVVYEKVAIKWESDYRTVAAKLGNASATPRELINELDRREKILLTAKQRIDYLLTQLDMVTSDRLDKSREIAKLRDEIRQVTGTVRQAAN